MPYSLPQLRHADRLSDINYPEHRAAAIMAISLTNSLYGLFATSRNKSAPWIASGGVIAMTAKVHLMPRFGSLVDRMNVEHVFL